MLTRISKVSRQGAHAIWRWSFCVKLAFFTAFSLTLQTDFSARWCLFFCKWLFYWTSLPSPAIKCKGVLRAPAPAQTPRRAQSFFKRSPLRLFSLVSTLKSALMLTFSFWFKITSFVCILAEQTGLDEFPTLSLLVSDCKTLWQTAGASDS